jgi:pyruvate dehydrogenase (quinone)
MLGCQTRSVPATKNEVAVTIETGIDVTARVVLEVKTDPDVVPLPPHVTLKEARGFLSSIAKGDAGGGSVIRETALQV